MRTAAFTAEIIPALRFDILKGRGRYICESRLEGAVNDDAQDSLLGDEFQDAFAAARWQAKGIPRDSVQAMRWFKNVAKKLCSRAPKKRLYSRPYRIESVN